jgi:hypothetical protein
MDFMPILVDDVHGVALDMHGCPNRCRHCYLGPAPGGHMAEADLRWAVKQFRGFLGESHGHRARSKLQVSTWLREPDLGGDYQRLHELECELSDAPSERASWELLSVWRAAHDPEYPHWAHDIGVRVCQISFFGLDKATDWGYRRTGAFQDALTATERLLEVGIRPRWQWFLTRRLLPDLAGLIALTERMRLRERCEALGGPFTLFTHCPGPSGEAWHLEHLRPTLEEITCVPHWLREQSEKHLGGTLGEAEGQLVTKLRHKPQPLAQQIRDVAPGLWFFVLPNWDVYSNLLGELNAGYRLGNLQTDSVAAIVDALENDRPAGLQGMFHVPVAELAVQYGRPYGRRLYAPSELEERWLHMWVRDRLRAADSGGD